MNAQAPTFTPPSSPPRTPASERRAHITVVHDDQVFIDNLVMLWGSRWIISIAMVLGGSLGFTAAWIIPPKYSLSSIIEIGTLSGPDGQTVPIESLDTAVIKLTNVFAVEIAMTQEQFGDRVLEAVNPARTNLAILSARTTVEHADVYAELQRQTATRLMEAHRSLQEPIRSDLEHRLKQEQARTQSLREDLKRLAEAREMVARMLSVIGSDQPENGAGPVTEAPATGALAMRPLEPSERIMLLQEYQRIADHERDGRSTLQGSEQMVSRLALQLERTRPTVMIASPTRSERPLGSGPAVFVTVGAFIGAILAFLGVTLVRKLKMRQR